MSACPQCGTVAKPTDKFCNTCGTRLPEAAANPQQYAPQAQQPAMGGFGAPPQPGMQGAPARCQMGHDIAPGASYCAQGHPIALAGMQFAQDQYAAPQQQAYAPPQAPAAQPQQPPFGGQGGFGGYQPPQQAPQPSASPIGGPQAYDPNAAGFGGGGFAQQQPAPQAQGYAQQPGFPAPQAPQAPQYSPQAFAPPAQPQQPVFNPAAQPPQPGPAGNAPSAPPAANYGAAPSASTTPDSPTKTLRGFLVAYQANAIGEFWPLTGGRLMVGRTGSGENPEIGLADPTISSKHAAFSVDGTSGAIAVEDTGSTNGTFVNEEHIGFNGRRDLKDGDRVRFGGFTTIVKVIGRI
jgi:pSer/pThr/pTyr-binding forkhead associated (FHA) protein